MKYRIRRLWWRILHTISRVRWLTGRVLLKAHRRGYLRAPKGTYGTDGADLHGVRGYVSFPWDLDIPFLFPVWHSNDGEFK